MTTAVVYTQHSIARQPDRTLSYLQQQHSNKTSDTADNNSSGSEVQGRRGAGVRLY